MAGMDRQKHLFAGVVREFCQITIFADQRIIFVCTKIRKRAVEAKRIYTGCREPVCGNTFLAIEITAIGRFGIVRNFIHNPIDGTYFALDVFF